MFAHFRPFLFEATPNIEGLRPKLQGAFIVLDGECGLPLSSIGPTQSVVDVPLVAQSNDRMLVRRQGQIVLLALIVDQSIGEPLLGRVPLIVIGE